MFNLFLVATLNMWPILYCYCHPSTKFCANISIYNWVVRIWWDSRWWSSAMLDFQKPGYDHMLHLAVHRTSSYQIWCTNFWSMPKLCPSWRWRPPSWIDFLWLFWTQIAVFQLLISMTVQNSIPISQSAPELSNFSKFKMAAVRHVGFWETRLLSHGCSTSITVPNSVQKFWSTSKLCSKNQIENGGCNHLELMSHSYCYFELFISTSVQNIMPIFQSTVELQ